MKIKTKTLIFLVVTGLVDVVIPIPILAIILLSVVIKRPPWFMNTVKEIYHS